MMMLGNASSGPNGNVDGPVVVSPGQLRNMPAVLVITLFQLRSPPAVVFGPKAAVKALGITRLGVIAKLLAYVYTMARTTTAVTAPAIVTIPNVPFGSIE